jgi:hypothetical protein
MLLADSHIERLRTPEPPKPLVDEIYLQAVRAGFGRGDERRLLVGRRSRSNRILEDVPTFLRDPIGVAGINPAIGQANAGVPIAIRPPDRSAILNLYEAAHA